METRLIMLGAAPGTRSAIACVVEAYRVHGLFRRWPIEYVATRSGGGALDSARTAMQGLRRLAALLGEAVAQRRRLIVHAHCDARSGFWREALFMRIAAAAGCPLIIHLHGGGFERLHDEAGPTGRAIMRSLFERAVCVIAPSETQRAWARGMARRANVACVPHPVALQDIAPAEERSAMVLFLGRLEAEHGLFDLLQAVARLCRESPDRFSDLRLVCAGVGERAEAVRCADRLGIGAVVKFTGWVGPSGKRALFENASVIALPRYSAGLPTSLLEAMAAGVPAIASPVGAIPEVLNDGASGVLVAPGDIAALTRALRKLLLDRAFAERIGAAGRETVRARFAPDRVMPRLEEIYADAGLAAQAPQPSGRGVDLRKAA